MSKVKELKQESTAKAVSEKNPPVPKQEDLMKEIFYLRQRLDEKTTYETIEWIKVAVEVIRSGVLTESENKNITDKIRSVMVSKTETDQPTKSGF